MIRASRGDSDRYEYDTVSVVLGTELFKLALSLIFHFSLFVALFFSSFLRKNTLIYSISAGPHRASGKKKHSSLQAT